MRSVRVGLWIAAAMLAVAPADAENAKRREDSGSSSSSSSGSSSSSSSGSTRSRGDSGSSRDDHGSSSAPSAAPRGSSQPRTEAERNHPRPGTGTGDRRDRDGGYGYGGYGYHGRRGGWRGGIWVEDCYDCIYDPGYYPRYRYRYRYYDDSASVRIQVEPQNARVYVDGYYAGTVEDFNGLFQRLYVPRGRHEITLKLEGYRAHRFMIYGVPGRTIKLRYDMVRGSGEDEAENLAGDAPPDDKDVAYDEEDPSDVRDFGKLRLDVRPTDAAVYIDGQPYPRANEDDVKLPAGTHRLEVVRPGYLSLERDVEIRADKTAKLDVELEKK
jgi:hypothetical protein